MTLLENGVEVARRDLVDATPSAQSAAFQVAGGSNGTYVYTAVLANQHGSTTTAPLTVVVSKANPATPVLSHDSWDGDGTYTVDQPVVGHQRDRVPAVRGRRADRHPGARRERRPRPEGGHDRHRPGRRDARLPRGGVNAAGTTSSTDLKVVVRR